MKIEGNRPNVDPSAAAKVDAGRVASKKGKETGSAGGDAVTVSTEVQLARKAIDTASQSFNVRPEAVARGKALLASGTLGADPHKLADTLIQRLLDGQD
jgi:flagellar biosynthesis anti-sigma factor FlgM